MKRIIEIIILIILITFLVPIVLTQKFKAKETVAIENEVENVEQNMIIQKQIHIHIRNTEQ